MNRSDGILLMRYTLIHPYTIYNYINVPRTHIHKFL